MKLNRKNFAEFFRTDFYTVSVVFVEDSQQSSLQELRSTQYKAPQQKRYDYKISKDMKVTLGDKLLVCTDNNLQYVSKLKVVTVVAINVEPEIDGDNCFEYKWIVGRLDEALVGYVANVEKDLNLKRAVSKLEQALERVSVRKQLESAFAELGVEDRKELSALFGTDIFGKVALAHDSEKSTKG